MNLRLSNNPKHIFNRTLKYEMKQDQFLIMFANITNQDRDLLIDKFNKTSIQIDILDKMFIADYQPLQAYLVKEDFERMKLKFTHHSLKIIETTYNTIPSIRLDVRNFK